MSAQPQGTWLPTTKAAKIFGFSPYTLRRWGSPKTGFLCENVRWKRGMEASHPHAWNMQLCNTELKYKGFCLLIGLIK